MAKFRAELGNAEGMEEEMEMGMGEDDENQHSDNM
jgi:hypothetical protein